MINRWPKCCEETEVGIVIPRQEILMPSRKRVDGVRGWWPCGCCDPCPPCTGENPSAFQVVIANILDDTCTDGTCQSTVNGTYIVPNIPPIPGILDKCTYNLVSTLAAAIPCPIWNEQTRAVSVDLSTLPLPGKRIQVTYFTMDQTPPCFDGSCRKQEEYRWHLDLPAKIKCTEILNLSIPFFSRVDPDSNPFNCDASSSTCLLTAL